MEITIKGLVKSYQAREVLRIGSYSFASGSIHQISGANGAGKSTFFEILSLLDDAYAGQVCFNGRDIRSIVPDGRTVTSVFQKPVMLSRPVRKNLTYPLELKRTPREVIEERMAFCLDFLPLEGLLNHKGTELSLGEAQKASLIRGLMMQTPILLLDEPFSAMDRSSREQSLEMILAHQALTGATILIVSHRELEHPAMTLHYLEGGTFAP